MAFHPYPKVIPSVFNRSGFGPPRGLTPASACPGVAHPASRRRRATHIRPVRTCFRCGSVFPLTSPHTATRWLILQKARRHSVKDTAPTACRHTVSGAVSLPSRGAFHLSLTVLIRYRSRRVFSLGGRSPLLRPGFLVSGPTRDSRAARGKSASHTGLSPALAGLPMPFCCACA